MAEQERAEVALEVVADLLKACAQHGLQPRELARGVIRSARKMVKGSSTVRRASRVERFLSPEFIDIPEGTVIPLLREQDFTKTHTHAPKPYGLIRRLATDLRYQPDLELAIFDVFDKAEALVETLPVPRLAGDVVLPSIVDGGRAKSRQRMMLASTGKDYNVDNLVVAALCGDLLGLTQMLDMKDRDGEALVNIDGIHASLKYTALHAAVEFGQLESVRLLVERGANVNGRCARMERTPLFYAAMHRRAEIARFLISKGAKRKLRDAEGIRAYMVVEVASEEDEKLRDFLRDPPGRVPAVILKASLATSLRIEWDENMFDKSCSRIDYYVVRWRVKPSMHEAVSLTTTSLGTSQHWRDDGFRLESRENKGWSWDKCLSKTYDIGNLLPATEYVIQVVAHSQVGFGPPSRPNSFRTLGTVPEPPASAPLLVRSSPDSLLLCIKPPERDNGHPVTGYVILYRLYATVGASGVETKATRSIWHTHVSEGPGNHFVVPSLYKSCKYVFKARAQNLMGQSDFSEESQPLLTSHPVQTVSKTSESIIITWLSHPLREVSYFDVQIKTLQDEGDLRAPFVSLVDGLTDMYYEVKGLLPASFYQFRVRTTYRGAEMERWEDGIVSDEIRTENDRPGPPTEPVLVPGSMMQTSAIFTWKVEHNNGQPILEHEVSLSHKLNQWTLVGTTEDNSICARDLPINRRLFFRVRVRNSLGWSDYSPESRCLEIFVVPPPSTPSVGCRGATWVDLTYEPPYGFAAQRYQIRMRKAIQELGIVPVPRHQSSTAAAEDDAADGCSGSDGVRMEPMEWRQRVRHHR